jgi:hypothetical protein
VLVNLSPKKTFNTEAEIHAKYMNRHIREYDDEKYKPRRFSELFAPTNYIGVYLCWDKGMINSWCKQRVVYGSKTYWNTLDNIPRNRMRELISYDNNVWYYGVADNIEQVLELYNKNEFGYFKGNHVILCNEIIKDPNEPCSGWRWHKWGEYIGTQNPQCEYLNDEPEIDRVITFSIVKVI